MSKGHLFPLIFHFVLLTMPNYGGSVQMRINESYRETTAKKPQEKSQTSILTSKENVIEL